MKNCYSKCVVGETCVEFEAGADRNAVWGVIAAPYASSDPTYWHFGEYVKVCPT